MLSTKGVRIACAVAIAAGVSVATALAQPTDKRTLFTFSGPVTMPGVTLPAGQYVFRLLNPNTSGRVVQVVSADGTKPYGLFFSLASERLEGAPKAEVRFMETAKGMPAAIKTWWYPGERTGYEFIYPKDQARKLVQGTSQSVLTTQAETTTTEQTNTSELTRVSAGGPDTNVNVTTRPTAGTPTGVTQEGTIASPSIAIPNASRPAVAQTNGNRASVVPEGTQARATRTRLPKTAGNVPLIGMVGVLALLGAASVYFSRNRKMQRR